MTYEHKIGELLINQIICLAFFGSSENAGKDE